jgi:transposase
MLSKKELQKFSKKDLVEYTYQLGIKYDKLLAKVEELIEKVKELSVKKDSSNSSLPPSHDLFHNKNKSLRVKSDKKSGGQPGHQGVTLLPIAIPDIIIKHFPDEKCPRCGKIHSKESMKMVESRQVIDIPEIKAFTKEYLQYESNCECGYTNTGKFPVQVTAPVQYGRNLVSYVAYLSSRQFVPYNRLAELIKATTGISMSEGTIYNMLNKVATSLMPSYQAIKDEVSKAAVIGGDESSVMVMSQKHWAWVWQTVFATYIEINNTRGYAAVLNAFPNGFPSATYVSDSLATQLKIPAKNHQVCIVHILRDLNFLKIIYLENWSNAVYDLFQRAIVLKRDMKLNQYTEPFAQRDSIIKEFDILLKDELPNRFPKLISYQKSLKRRRPHMFNFLYYPDVPADNNGSERAIRNVKVKLKISGCFRSVRGSEIFSILRSVIDTTIKREGNPFETIKFALNVATKKKQFQANHLIV